MDPGDQLNAWKPRKNLHLSVFYKVFVNRICVIVLFSILSFCSFSKEKDTVVPFESYKKRLVLYFDFGYNTAPMSVGNDFDNGIKKLKFRNNFNPVIGLGFAYKWMALRFNIALPDSDRSKLKYGKTKYLDLGLDFSFRNMYFDLNWHLYQGFALKDAYKWNDTILTKKDNIKREDINSYSVSINAYQFWNEHFKMFAFKGRTASYQKDVRTFFLKYTTSLHGISSAIPIIPIELQDSLESKTRSTSLGAIDAGVVPGYAYVRRWKAFQFGVMGGLGLVIQSKYYTFDGQTRSFIGLAPRIDFKLMGGVNLPKYFVMLVGDFDNKSTRFNELRHIQTYYNIKIAAGFRLNVTKKKEAKEAEALKKMEENGVN